MINNRTMATSPQSSVSPNAVIHKVVCKQAGGMLRLQAVHGGSGSLRQRLARIAHPTLSSGQVSGTGPANAALQAGPQAPPLHALAQQRPVMTAATGSPRPGSPKRAPVLLFDVMDTLVYDPFFKDMPQFFNMSFQDLLKAKHPTAWVEFECGRWTEEQLLASFFADGRPIDGPALRAMMASSYRWLDGMEDLLGRLSKSGYEMHALSNYPVWWEMIEEKLGVSRYMPWTFLSCTGPMEGHRKPSPEAYARVISHLGLPPSQLLFIDDRQVNTDAAAAVGIPSVPFTGAAALEAALKGEYGLEL